jgi:DNA-binding transcriptional LysR family regulator
LVDDATAVQRRPTGIVSVGVLPAMSRALVSRLYNLTQDEFPGIQLRVFEAYSGEIEVLLSEGRIDLGIFNRYRPLRREVQDALFTTDMCLVAKVGASALQRKSLRFSALAGLPLVLPMRPNSLRALLDEIANKQRVQLRVVLEADSAAVIKDSVLNCGLYCVLPPHAVAEEYARGLLEVIRITHPVIRQTMFVDATRRRPMTGAAKEVLGLLSKLVRELDAQRSAEATLAAHREERNGRSRR